MVSTLFVVAAVRFRRRDDGLPAQREGWPRAELVYALSLAAVAVALLTVSFKVLSRVDALALRPGLTVRVTAFQWGWRFTYPGSGVTVVGDQRRPPQLVVPSDTTVRFELTSRDVVHAFWIPELRFKRDAFPLHTNRFDLVFPPGRTLVAGKCAEFCGLHHSTMLFEVRVLEPARFAAWIGRQARTGAR